MTTIDNRMTFLLCIILLLIALLVYTWIVYPLLLALFSRGRRLNRTPQSTSPESANVPRSVEVLIAAHNEEAHIEQRLQNLLDTANPLAAPAPSTINHQPSTISVHLGCDACTDRTVEIASAFAREHANVHVHDFEQRRGKCAVIKDLVRISGSGVGDSREEAQRCTEEENRTIDRQGNQGERGGSPAFSPLSTDLLVFTDANTVFATDALEKLLRPFADPGIGGVCGRLVLAARDSRDPDNACALSTAHRPPSTVHRPPSTAESAYWNLETWMKERESSLDSCLGANGAIYAIRRELFWKDIPDNTIIDDFVIGMKVREQGCRMVYEPAAVAEEELPEQKDEWRRRVRIGAGDYQALALCRRSLLPLALSAPLRGSTLDGQDSREKAQEARNTRTSGFRSQVSGLKSQVSGLIPHPSSLSFPWFFWSHKVLRWFTPHALVLLLATAAWHGALCWVSGVGCRVSLAIVGGYTLAALLALATRVLPFRPGPLRAVDHFVTMQAALFAGFVRFCCGRLSGHWSRTPRSG